MSNAYQTAEAQEEATLRFKRHILQKSAAFAAEPHNDLFRINLLGMMLTRYDELKATGLSEFSCVQRTLRDFDDIADRMRDAGCIDAQEGQTASRWPTLSEEDVETYLRESDERLHRQSMGIGLCAACVMPLMVANAFSEVLFAHWQAFEMLGLVGMFAMIAVGVYAIVTAAKPQKHKIIKQGRFSLGRRLREKVSALAEQTARRARKRLGRGVAMLVACVMPIFIGAALSEGTYSDMWPLLGIAGMFAMIGAGVYELVMADGEKKTVKRLLGEEDARD